MFFLPEWLKLKTQTIPSIDKDAKKLENSYKLLIKMYNGVANLEKSLTFKKNKQNNIYPSNSTARYLPKRIENMSMQILVHKCS